MQLPEHIKVIIWDGFWTRQDVINNSDKLFLFGDNVDQAYSKEFPRSTQAVIRGLPNALGVVTKYDSNTGRFSYFEDAQPSLTIFKLWLDISKEEILRALEQQNIVTLVLPKDGIGTGKAMLKEKAPKCWELLQEFLAPLYERAKTQKEFPTFIPILTEKEETMYNKKGES